MDETTYLSAAQVAERLGISLRTVRRRIADGTLPSLKVGGAVRIPASALAIPDTEASPPAPGGHAAREAAVPYGTARESDEAYIRRWNREHWPDSWERMLERRRQAFERLDEARKQTRPPSGPHDTVDAILNQVRDEFGQRLLQFIPERKEEAE
jgi:excisionase family DNA binding protein